GFQTLFVGRISRRGGGEKRLSSSRSSVLLQFIHLTSILSFSHCSIVSIHHSARRRRRHTRSHSAHETSAGRRNWIPGPIPWQSVSRSLLSRSGCRKLRWWLST